METLFTLPLFLILCVQALTSLVLLLPKAVSLPVASLTRHLTKNAASASFVYTVTAAFGLLSLASFYELVKGAERARASGLRGEVLSTVDFLRSQVSCVLSVANFLLVLLNQALAERLCSVDSLAKNLFAMQRQVKGLQAAYDAASSGPPDAAVGEVAVLKKQVDKLLAAQQQQQGEVEAARKATRAAEASVEAMKKQIQGLDTEYDRLLAENKALRLQAGDPSTLGKKDD